MELLQEYMDVANRKIQMRLATIIRVAATIRGETCPLLHRNFQSASACRWRDGSHILRNEAVMVLYS